jgi:hypothetical protein
MSNTDFSDSGVSTPAPTRRPGRGGEGGTPVTGALTIGLAVVAVIAGFLILRSISADGNGAAITPGPGNVVTTEPLDPNETVPVTTDPAPPVTTEPPLVFDGGVVVVANANNVNGSAGMMTRALEAAGFTMGDAVNAARQVGQLETTAIYYDSSVDAARAVAESVKRLLGNDASVAPLPEVAPTSDGTLAGEVLVMLGNDKAGKSLEELAPPEVAPTVTSPGVAGDVDPEDETTTQ